MLTKLKQHLALFVSFVLVVSCIPTAALADAARDGDASDSGMTHVMLYRTHALGTNAWNEDEGWQAYADQTEEQDSQEKSQPEESQAEEPQEVEPQEEVKQQVSMVPLDSIEMKLGGDAKGVSYKVRDAEGEWSEGWMLDGEAASAEQGITGVQVKLSDELDGAYDVWYRARVEMTNDEQPVEAAIDVQVDAKDLEEDAADETVATDVATKKDGWLDWVEGDGELVTPSNEPLTAFEVVLVAEGAGYPGQNVEQVMDEETPEAADTADTAPVAEEPLQTTTVDETSETPVTSVASEAASSEPSVEYRVHVQTYGWRGWAKDGAQAGTTGESKRLEGLYIHLNNASGGIEVQTHVQTYGWQNWVGSDQLAGTTGQSKRLEGVRLRLTGSVANSYDVWYRVHVQTYGWMGWVKNGELAGTTGQSKRMEALEVLLVRKGGTIPAVPGAAYEDKSVGSATGVHYQSHVQSYGWMSELGNGRTSGTIGQAKRLEAVRIKTTGIDGGIRYRAHVQSYGWQGWVSNGAVAGTTGQAKRLEAIQIELTGNAANTYDVYYRTHVQTYGWQRWVKNGQTAGTTGLSKRAEAIQVIIQKQGLPAPAGDSETQLHGVDISGWNKGISVPAVDADFVIIKATEGVQGTIYNTSYQTWANQALASGKLLGFYHYANGGDPEAEATSFYYAIKDYKGRAIACLDWEGQDNARFGSGEDVTWCKRFLDRLKSLYGGTPFIYMSKSHTQVYNWSSVAHTYPLWGAQYPDYNAIYGYQSDPWQSSSYWGAWGSQPQIFQYTSTGVLTNNGGIKYFDFNLFYGTRADWASYLR